MELVENLHGHGAIPDEKDERDYQWHRVAMASAPFNWVQGYDIEVELSNKLGRPFTIPSKNQGQSYSCGGQAFSYYASVFSAMNLGTWDEDSAKFPYSQCFVDGGGSGGRPLCNILTSQGCASESLCPSYENGLPPTELFMERPQDITQEAKNNALLDKALIYANVTPNIDTFADAISKNYGLVFGLNGENNGTWLSAFPVPPSKLSGTWAHWIYAGKAKMIDGKKYIGFKNSWGDEVGQKGWQWIGEDYFKTGAVWSGWTLTFDNANLVAKLKGIQLSLMQQLLNLLKEKLASLLKK